MSRVNLLALGAALLGTAPALSQAPAAPKAPQAPAASAVEAVGHSASLSRRTARLVVDLSDGSAVTISLTGGTVSVNTQEVGSYVPGGPFELAWRSVLSKAGPLTTPELVFTLRSLPTGSLGPGASETMAAITGALPSVNRSALPGPPPDVGALASGVPVNLDSVNETARQISQEVAREVAGRFRDAPESSFSVSRMATDVAGLFGTLVALASLGFGALFFVPHRLEIVADTVRRSPIRSFVAGLFAQPLLLPALVTLIIGLVLTIVGVLVVPVAIIAFVLAVAAALVGGYLAVARVVGEIYARRRVQNGGYTAGWSTFRYMVYGLVGLLMIWAPGVLMRSIPVAGDILLITALVFTWAMATTGFGATILSKAGGGWKFGPPPARPEISSEYLWSSAVPARPTEARKGSA